MSLAPASPLPPENTMSWSDDDEYGAASPGGYPHDALHAGWLPRSRPNEAALHALVLDLSASVRMPGPAEDFLRQFGEARGLAPNRPALDAYLDEVWPSRIPNTLYAANAGMDPHAASHLRELLLRPACEGPQAARPAVGGYALGLQVYRRKGKLAVRRLEVTPHVPPRHFERRLSAPIIWDDPDAFMGGPDFEALAGIPFQRARTNDRLGEWRRYLEWKERMVRADQTRVPFGAWRWTGETKLAFLVRERDLSKRLAGLELGATAEPPPEEEAAEAGGAKSGRRRRDPEVTALGEVESVRALGRGDVRGPDDWGDVKLTPEHRLVELRLDEDTAQAIRRRDLPAQGVLVSSLKGDLAPLRNQSAGVSRLQANQGFAPRLADVIFDGEAISVPVAIPDLPDVPAGRTLNPGQREAVAKALAAHDLCLIQGPPGTGKTTVIAEICLRATRDGKRVLVASQTNLAVDNALARLSDVPWVRPLRVGAPDRVDEEFKDLLADRVVDRWFASIADHCRGRAAAAVREEAALKDRDDAVAAMARALADHEVGATAAARAREEADRARVERDSAASSRAAAREALDARARRAELLEALARWAGGDGVLPPGAAAEPWPVAAPVPAGLAATGSIASELAAQRSRLPGLEAVLEALVAVEGGEPSDLGTAEELRALRAEKRALVDSDEEADMRRLRAVNGRIKELERGGWNRVTGALGRAARDAWPEGQPRPIAVLVDALAPSSDTAESLLAARSLVEAERAAAAEAAEAIARSVERWRTLCGAARQEREAARHDLERAEEDLAKAEAALEGAREAARRGEDEVRAARARWDRSWRAVWPESAPAGPQVEAVELAGRAAAHARTASAARLERAGRWRTVQAEWCQRLSSATDADREHLEALYIRHANVVGMTCNEAGKSTTWRAPGFRPFDIVIVDEVSKATPPELILPLLLGEKGVLVGDHRQLPPLFRERGSFGEAAEEGEIATEDLARFRRMVTASLFEELFERAPEACKATLWTQYRMHPDIMDATNQFYEGRLEAGPDREQLAAARRHHLTATAAGGGRLLTPAQHLVWVDTSRKPDGGRAWEEQRGSSKVNLLEVEVVAATLVRLGAALAERGYGPTRELHVAETDAGRTWREIARDTWPDLPAETLDDLFAERRVRVDGRAQQPGGAAHAGARVELRAQKEIGLITLYGAQLKALRCRLDRARRQHRVAFAAMELRTNTVDRFQGMEKPIVILSLVRAKKGPLGAFVREFQRINVALSRARQLLVVVGAEETWKRVEVPLPPIDGGPPADVPAYHNILELARRTGGRRLARQVLNA